MAYIVVPKRYTNEIIQSADTNQLMDDIEAIVHGEVSVTVDSVNGVHIGSLSNGKLLKYTSTGSYIVSTTLSELNGALAGITTLVMSNQFVNTTPNGTAPFIVSSSTKVDNLHADKLDGADLSTDGTFIVVSSTGSDLLVPSQKAVKTFVEAQENIFTTLMKDPTGFDNPADVVVTYSSTGRTITLTGTFIAYWQGKIIPDLVSGWVSDPHDPDEGTWYLYYDGSYFIWSQIKWEYYNLQIAFVYYTASDKFGIKESHGLMEWMTQETLHESIGTYKESGGDLSDYTLSSTTATDRRPSVSSCYIQYEDVTTLNSSLPSNGPYTQLKLTSTGKATFLFDQVDIVPLATDNPYYNSYSDPNWGQTLMPANSVATVWLLEIPVTSDVTSQQYRHIWVQPQWFTQAASGSAGNLAIARATEELRSPSQLNLGNLRLQIPEYIVITRLTIQYTSGWWAGVKWSIENVINLIGSKYSLLGTPSVYFTSVVTDATLTGNGTVSNPLSVVNASVVTDATISGTGTVLDPLHVIQNYVTSTGNQTIGGIKTFSEFPITPSDEPTNDYEVANKKYVDDNSGSGGSGTWKTSVRVATSTGGTLATSFANGQVIDGITLQTNDRILIKDQIDQKDNGIYIVNPSGAPTRALDANTGDLLREAIVFVELGTVNSNTGFICTSTVPITVGISNITFAAFAKAPMGTYYEDQFTATLGQTTFTLTIAPYGKTYMFVFVDSIYQKQSSYGITGNTLVMTVGLIEGQTVVVKYLYNAILPQTSNRYEETFAATAGQTVFTLVHTPISYAYLDVLVNGTGQAYPAFTLSSNVVTFSEALTLNDIVNFRIINSLYSVTPSAGSVTHDTIVANSITPDQLKNASSVRLAAKNIDGATNTINTNIALYTVSVVGFVDNLKLSIVNRNTSTGVMVRLAHIDGAIGSIANEDYLFYDIPLVARETKEIDIYGAAASDTFLIRSDTTNVNFVLYGQTVTYKTNERLSAIDIDGATHLINTNYAAYTTTYPTSFSFYMCNKNVSTPAYITIAMIDSTSVGDIANEDYLFIDYLQEGETKSYENYNLQSGGILSFKSDTAGINMITYGRTLI